MYFYETDNVQSVCYLPYSVDDSYLQSNRRNVVKAIYTPIKDVEKRFFAGIVVNVPKNPERLLVEKYGESWMIPTKNWIYWKAPTTEHCEGFGKVVTY